MLLFLGIWLAVGGYSGLVWGQKVTAGNPQSFRYLIGLSEDPGTTVAGAAGGGSSAPTRGSTGTTILGKGLSGRHG